MPSQNSPFSPAASHHSLIFQGISVFNYSFQLLFQYIQLLIASLAILQSPPHPYLSPFYVYFKVDQVLFSAFEKSLLLEIAQAKNTNAIFT